MKNTLLTAIAILISGYLCSLGLPWWGITPVAVLIGWFFAANGLKSFFGGFLGGFLLWYSTAWFADDANAGMLSTKVGQLFMGLNGQQLILVTGVLGGMLAAFAALTGKMAKDMLIKPNTGRKRNYLQERRR